VERSGSAAANGLKDVQNAAIGERVAGFQYTPVAGNHRKLFGSDLEMPNHIAHLGLGGHLQFNAKGGIVIVDPISQDTEKFNFD
jgi:hypothetical protein